MFYVATEADDVANKLEALSLSHLHGQVTYTFAPTVARGVDTFIYIYIYITSEVITYILKQNLKQLCCSSQFGSFTALYIYIYIYIYTHKLHGQCPSPLVGHPGQAGALRNRGLKAEGHIDTGGIYIYIYIHTYKQNI